MAHQKPFPAVRNGVATMLHKVPATRALSGGRTAARPPGMFANVGAMATGRVVASSLIWIASLIIVRSLSPVDFGKFTFIFSILGMLSIITDLQIGRIAVVRLSSGLNDPGRFGGNYVLLRLALGVVGYALAVGFVAAAGYPADVVRATAVAGVVVVVATPANAYNAVFEARMRLRPIAFATALGAVGQLALTAAIAAAGGTVLLFAIPVVLCELLEITSKATAAHRVMPLRYRIDLPEWWSLIREAVPLSIGAGLMLVYYRIDAVMLTKLDSFTAAGAYGVAYKFVDLAHSASLYVGMAVLPLLARTWPHQPAAFRAATGRAAFLLSVLGGLLVCEFTVFAESVIRTLYGARYAPAADAARLVVASECVAFFTFLAFNCLVAAGRNRRYPLVTLLGLLVNVALNLVAIPRWSYLGAAVSTLVTDVMVCVLMTLLLRRIPGMRPLPTPPWLRVLCAALCGAVVGWSLARFTFWPLAAIVTAVVYAAVLRALRALWHRDGDPGEPGGTPAYPSGTEDK
ncbi:polysaccharide biosynthesis C-terminal domain-containing protein [Streptomyces sp. NPDC014006]|uniref:oligosaccharide flippase family protein n=1 Tax=Streptomyces sp. NPDC014006 TaxID=3364870 RepID=UPI0036FAD6B7